MLMEPKRFANDALDAVAPDGVADYARGDRESEPGSPAFVAAHEDRERAVCGAACVAVHAVEFGFRSEALRRLERPSGSVQVKESERVGARSGLADAQTLRRLRPFARRRAST